MNKTIYISQLTKEQQEAVQNELRNFGFAAEDIQNAMDSRLCDLGDTIDVNYIIKG